MGFQTGLSVFRKHWYRWLSPLLPALLMGLILAAAPWYSALWLGCGGTAVLLCVGNVLYFLRQRGKRAAGVLLWILRACVLLGLTVICVTGAFVLRAGASKPEKGYDYIVVLGAGVNGTAPSMSLAERIDAAYGYLAQNPDTIAVVSGGKGGGENITEAQCMFNCLTAMGIEPRRVWMEDQAASTRENLRYSLRLIEEKTGERPGRIGVVSSEYHLFRAGLFAVECDVACMGIPAKTTNLTRRVNYTLREVVGVWYYWILGG